MHDGCCTHGIPLDEACLLCTDTEEEKTERQIRDTTTFDQDVELLVRVMISLREWATAVILIKRLRAHLSLSDCARFTKTYLRHLAKASRGRILSGQKGYKATKRATTEEGNEAAAGLMKAAQGCMDRRRDILFVLHHGRAQTEQERKTSDVKKETDAAS